MTGQNDSLIKIQQYKKIGLDTMIFIYLIEKNLAYIDKVIALFEIAEYHNIQISCSTLLITELFLKPTQMKREDLIEKYKDILFYKSRIKFIDVNIELALKAAEIAGKHNLRTPDSIHIASSIYDHANAFITADKRIKNISGIEIIHL